MKYFYYPGCSLHSTALEYDMSLRAVCEKIGIELVDIKNWICCGASSAHSLSYLLPDVLVGKNLSGIGDERGEVLIPCAACYSRFKIALHNMKENQERRRNVEEITGKLNLENIRIIHPLELFKDKIDEIASIAKNSLFSLRVACYYGCLLVRPPSIMKFDIYEYPEIMNKLLESLGAFCVEWSYSVECCGAFTSLVCKEVVLKLTSRILEDAFRNKADVISVACPLCQSNLDMRQEEINILYNKNYNIPVLYFTQLLGLSFGIEEKKLGLHRHFVDPIKIVRKISGGKNG